MRRTSRSLPLLAERPPEALIVPSAMTYGWRDRRGRTPTPAYVSFSCAHRRRGEVNYISRFNSLCSAMRTISCKHRQSLDSSNFPTSEASNRKLALHTIASRAGADAKLPKCAHHTGVYNVSTFCSARIRVPHFPTNQASPGAVCFVGVHTARSSG